MSDREKLYKEIERLEADNKRLQEIVEREMRNQQTLKKEQGEVFRAMQGDRDKWFEEAQRLQRALAAKEGDRIIFGCRRPKFPFRKEMRA